MTFKALKPRTGETFTLDFPFELEGETYETLTLRRPRQSDITALADGKGGAAGRSNRTLANLADVPVAVIENLDPVDIDKINAWLEPILDPNGRLSKGDGS